MEFICRPSAAPTRAGLTAGRLRKCSWSPLISVMFGSRMHWGTEWWPADRKQESEGSKQMTAASAESATRVLSLANCNFRKPQGMSQCYIPSLYVVHLKGALDSGE